MAWSSLFAAQAGAAKVIAVDASTKIAEAARQVIGIHHF